MKRFVFFLSLFHAVTVKCRPALFKCRDRYCAGKGLRYPCCSYTKVVIGWITHISCFCLPDRALKAPIIIADTARYLFNAVIICLLPSLFRILFSWGRMISVRWCKTVGFSFRKVITLFFFFLNCWNVPWRFDPRATGWQNHDSTAGSTHRRECNRGKLAASCCKCSAVCL